MCTYPHLADEVIGGNPDTKTDGELAEESRRVLDALYADELAELQSRYEQRVPQGRASDDLAAIARAATFGAVDTRSSTSARAWRASSRRPTAR